MADYNLIRNKSVALLIWHTERENDVQVFVGEIVQKDDNFYFINNSEKWTLRIDNDKLDELKEVTEDLKEILLNADLCLNLSIGFLPDDSNEDYFPTGMKWDQ